MARNVMLISCTSRTYDDNKVDFDFGWGEKEKELVVFFKLVLHLRADATLNSITMSFVIAERWKESLVASLPTTGACASAFSCVE